MSASIGGWIRVAELEELARIATGNDTSTTWPPPGGQVVFDPAADESPLGPDDELRWRVEPAQTGEVGVLYWTTLGALITNLSAWETSLLVRLARRCGADVPATVAALAVWPVTFERGRVVKWIKCTYRGTLGGVEQFQHQVLLGRPGADPDLDEAALLTVAQTIAANFIDLWSYPSGSPLGNISYGGLHTADVEYTSVGASQLVQTDATDAQGGGGNLSQSGETQWANLNGVTGYSGSAAAPSLPFECACAVSLRTDHSGPSGKGRFYLPPFAAAFMQAGGKYVTNLPFMVGAAWGQHLAANAVDTTWLPLVVSRRRIILNEVKQITVGVIPDSQRRRRWAQLEAPVSGWTKP